MAELVRTSMREAVGAADPAVHASGVTVRVLDPAGQFYATGGPALAPNTFEADRFWLTPDRTLVIGVAPTEGFVSDVSDGLVVFEIAGARADEIVAMGTTLDRALLAPGRCAQTLFGGVKVLLYAHGDGFRLHAERPFASFVLEWFTQSVSALEDFLP